MIEAVHELLKLLVVLLVSEFVNECVFVGVGGGVIVVVLVYDDVIEVDGDVCEADIDWVAEDVAESVEVPEID